MVHVQLLLHSSRSETALEQDTDRLSQDSNFKQTVYNWSCNEVLNVKTCPYRSFKQLSTSTCCCDLVRDWMVACTASYYLSLFLHKLFRVRVALHCLDQTSQEVVFLSDKTSLGLAGEWLTMAVQQGLMMQDSSMADLDWCPRHYKLVVFNSESHKALAQFKAWSRKGTSLSELLIQTHTSGRPQP